jgi:PTS system mannose-specific IIB component
MTAWVKYTKANKIIVVDDAVAKDDFMIQVLKMAVPDNIVVEIYSIVDAAEVLKKDIKETVVVLAKFPKTILSLMENKIEFKELNIGGMGAREGRKKFFKNISASDEELEILKKIISKNVDVKIQIVPDEKATDLKSLLK